MHKREFTGKNGRETREIIRQKAASDDYWFFLTDEYGEDFIIAIQEEFYGTEPTADFEVWTTPLVGLKTIVIAHKRRLSAAQLAGFYKRNNADNPMTEEELKHNDVVLIFPDDASDERAVSALSYWMQDFAGFAGNARNN